jgi:hypothetical protein
MCACGWLNEQGRRLAGISGDSVADTPQDTSDRLDSWKAIAAHLQRDETTARRWGREFGLPVRRVPGGRGHSVFAYASEIDAWLKTAPLTVAPPKTNTIGRARRRHPGVWFTVAAIVATAAGLTAVLARGPHPTLGELRIEVTPDGVVALDAVGGQRWKYPFDPAYKVGLPDDPLLVLTGEHPAVYTATHVQIRRSDGLQQSGTLLCLDGNGRLQQSFSFDDQVTFHGKTYGPPWAITSFAVDSGGGSRRIAVAAHHAVWEPSIVTVLDEAGHRHGTFVHAGWIESVQWLGPDRLLVGGFSNAHDGGMVALLDPSAPGGLDGQGPEPPDSQYYCETCGRGLPIRRMVILPRTEVNRAAAAPFNRARLQVFTDRVVARTIEVPAQAAVDVAYEFTRGLDLVAASYSDRYRELRSALETQGTLKRSHKELPGRDGPPAIEVWDSAAGWRIQRVQEGIR